MQDSDDELYLRYSNNFTAIRILDKTLLNTTWTIKTDMFVSSEIDDFQFNLILMKLKYFFDQILNDSIMFAFTNEWATESFLGETDNNVILLPYEPVDDIIANVLHSKLNALSEGLVTFASIDIESDNANGVSFLFIGVGERNLPSMKDWIGKRSYFSKPWWSRDDASTLDIVPPKKANLKEVPEFAYSLDFLKDSLKVQPTRTAKVIKPEFKPIIIQGSK